MAKKSPKKMTEEGLWTLVKKKIAEQGIRLEEVLEILSTTDEADVKVICAVDDLSSSLIELGDSTRDQVLMVRVDATTTEQLDAWSESGAVKSRSEAAALFIKEGLKLRSKELGELQESIDAVKSAKAKLHKRAKKVFGGSFPDKKKE